MKIYTSNRYDSYLTTFVVSFLLIVWLYYKYFYFVLLLLPFTLFPLFLITSMSVFDVNYFIQNGHLFKTKKRNLKGINNAFKINLDEIIKIEKHENLLREKYVSIDYGENKSINIYLESHEIDDFISEISEK
jgi:hypothetical protein